MKDIKQEMRKRFDEMTEGFEINNKTFFVDKDEILKSNTEKHLFYNFCYPESEFELDPDKIKSFIESEIDKAIVERDREIVEMIEKENSQNQITQAILSVMEYRGFNDCGKYIDSDIWKKIKPIFINLINSK